LVVLTPLTVFLVMFVVQLGLHFHARTVLNAAAQDGARAVQYEDGTSADGVAAADQILNGSRSLLTVKSLDVDPGPPTVTVTITADIISVIPFWSKSVTASASGPKEQFRPESER
jgi:Flp pilus assembly protein TadG